MDGAARFLTEDRHRLPAALVRGAQRRAKQRDRRARVRTPVPHQPGERYAHVGHSAGSMVGSERTSSSTSAASRRRTSFSNAVDLAGSGAGAPARRSISIAAGRLEAEEAKRPLELLLADRARSARTGARAPESGRSRQQEPHLPGVAGSAQPRRGGSSIADSHRWHAAGRARGRRSTGRAPETYRCQGSRSRIRTRVTGATSAAAPASTGRACSEVSTHP